MSRTVVLWLAMLVLAGCAAQRAFDEGQELIDAGKIPEGLAKVDEASRLAPGKAAYRQYYFRQRDMAVQRDLALAERARAANLFDDARAAYQQALSVDPSNARANAGLLAVRIDERHRALIAEAEEELKKGNDQAAYAKVRSVLTENSNDREAQFLLRRIEEKSMKTTSALPQLTASLRKPITLEFRDASLRAVFEMISKNAGLNFIFDRDVRPDLRVTLFVRNTSIEDAIRFILVTNQLERKVLNANTLLIYPNTPAKTKDYQELAMRSFFLANADVKQIANMVKALVKTKDMYVNEPLNLLVIRDTPEAVRVAEKLIATQDLAEPEVMLDLEVLEVNSSLLSQLGIRWPTQASASVVGAAGTPGTLTLPEYLNRNSGLVSLSVTDPLVILNLQEQKGKTNILANPHIRVKNKQKAKIHIGDKVPVFTSTSTATGLVAQNVSYLDVGLKLEVEPVVFLQDEVSIKLGLEVSSITQQVQVAGTLAYQIGTRLADTTLQLKDGETQMLAGLVNDEDRRVADNVPGIGDLPVLGRLFSSHNTTTSKSEIVLLITPHVVRNVARPELRLEDFASGTESTMGAAPLVLQSVSADEVGAAQGTRPGGGASQVPSSPEARQTAKISLLAPSQIVLGHEFTIQLIVDAAAGLRDGTFDFAYDPSRLQFLRAEPGKLLEAKPDAGFRANSPEGMGRLSLSITSAANTQGSGELARLTFRAMGAPGTPALRLESAALTDSRGKVFSAQLPPPLTVVLRAAAP